MLNFSGMIGTASMVNLNQPTTTATAAASDSSNTNPAIPSKRSITNMGVSSPNLIASPTQVRGDNKSTATSQINSSGGSGNTNSSQQQQQQQQQEDIQLSPQEKIAAFIKFKTIFAPKKASLSQQTQQQGNPTAISSPPPQRQNEMEVTIVRISQSARSIINQTL